MSEVVRIGSEVSAALIRAINCDLLMKRGNVEKTQTRLNDFQTRFNDFQTRLSAFSFFPYSLFSSGRSQLTLSQIDHSLEGTC